MPLKLEQLIKAVYKKWKPDYRHSIEPHPDDEAWACFFEDRLTQEESERIKEHLISCDTCAEVFSVAVRLGPPGKERVPQKLLQRAKNLFAPEDKVSVIEIILKLGEKALEILSTTGDVLVGEEFVPAPVLRSRRIKEFKDEVTILKDFKDIRVEVKIENKGAHSFDLIVFVKDKQTHSIIKDLRVTLLKEDLELESYLSTCEKVIFEHVSAGKYTVEISGIESKVASILLDIKK